MLHVPTGQCFGKMSQDLQTADEFKLAIKKAQEMFPHLDWLDCEGLLWRTKTGKGTLIVLDAPTLSGTYGIRREWLEARISQPPSLTEIPTNDLVLVPRFRNDMELWEQLKTINQQKGETLFDGIVAKRYDSIYTQGDTTYWIKFRFVA